MGVSEIILLPLHQTPWHPPSIPASIACGRAMADSCSHQHDQIHIFQSVGADAGGLEEGLVGAGKDEI